MKKSCRILVGLTCNYKCEYCCNKIPEIISKFTPIKLKDLDLEPYEDINISGGEIFLKNFGPNRTLPYNYNMINMTDILYKIQYQSVYLTDTPLDLKQRPHLHQMFKMQPQPRKNIFLYTNLSNLPRIPGTMLATMIAGWNIGFHPTQTDTDSFCERVKVLMNDGAKGVRVQCEDAEAWRLEGKDLGGAEVKLWTRNVCDKSDIEDWFILETEY